MMEFALTFPLLLVLVMSCLDYGYYLEHVDSIAGVVRDGARYASENTTGSPWNNSCTDPTPQSGGGWTCAGLVTQVASSPVQSVTAATIDVTSTTGFTAFTDGFDVATTNTSGALVVISCTAASTSAPWEFTGCSSGPYTGTLVAGAQMNGESNFVEGVIQEESEALTVPEGGLPVDNIDCCWSGTGQTTSAPCQSGNTTPAWGATVGVPSSWPVSEPGSPVSCMTISYWKNSDGAFTPPLTLCSWYSADAGELEPVGGACSPAANELVQITVAYNWSQEAPGPTFAVLNSVFGINVEASASYSFVVSN
jgi:Flp pilus assembly protein TadG